MIRRSFLRRMAYAAMAGMLGAELAWRVPKWDFDVALAKVKIDLLAEINEANGGGWHLVETEDIRKLVQDVWIPVIESYRKSLPPIRL